MLTRMRSLTQGARQQAQISSLTGMADDELLTEFERLQKQRQALSEQTKALKAELLLRRLLPFP